MTRKTILLVDDDPATCELLGAILADAGYEILMAGDGDDALAQMRAAPPSLVLLAMLIGGMDGWKFMDEKRHDASLAAVPVIIITALGVASEEWAQNLGAVALVRKPIDIELLLRKIDSRLAEG